MAVVDMDGEGPAAPHDPGDPARTGRVVSGVAHVGVLLWAILGGTLFRAPPPTPPQMTSVATMTEAQFQDFAAAARGSGPVAPGGTSSTSTSTPSPCRSMAANCTRSVPPRLSSVTVMSSRWLMGSRRRWHTYSPVRSGRFSISAPMACGNRLMPRSFTILSLRP